MNRATPRFAVTHALAGLLGGMLAAVACSSSSGSSSNVGASCASSSDCSGGTVCGFANAGGDSLCSSRGVCVTPVDAQPTNLCGCDGTSIEIVVNDVDAGVYYWSGVIVGEKGFPPCGDAAVAPSSNDGDATTDAAEDVRGDAGLDASVDAPVEASTEASAETSVEAADAPADVSAQ
jgi:uncharacterized protein YunC (DUF1805 family)